MLEGAGQAGEVSAEEKVLDLGCEGHALHHVVMWDLCVPDVPFPAPGPPGSELRRAQEGFVE